MKVIKIKDGERIPKNFTGIAKFTNGDKCWYKEGQLHREDGPAVEWLDGHKEWYQNDKSHRLDGPAIVDANGDKYWYIDDKEYTKAEFNKMKNKIIMPHLIPLNKNTKKLAATISKYLRNNGISDIMSLPMSIRILGAIQNYAINGIDSAVETLEKRAKTIPKKHK